MGINSGTRCGVALCVLIFCCNSFAQEVVLIGPIERVGESGTELRVLGQKVLLGVDAPTSWIAQARGISAQQRFIVSAILQPDSSYLASEVRALPGRYIPGATEVYIRGVISSVDAATAFLEMNGLRIYYGDLLNAQSLRLHVGEPISVVGRQSNPSGSVWASSIENVEFDKGTAEILPNTPAPYETVVHDQANNRNVDLLESITGTGIRQQSITGTGRQSQSITGTGVNQQSITWTGIQAQSITGTGIRLQSITGTGKQSQSITGTGVNQQSITGTGIRLQSITGTGRQSQSITGTGVNQQSITGTGIQAQSITGTGAF